MGGRSKNRSRAAEHRTRNEKLYTVELLSPEQNINLSLELKALDEREALRFAARKAAHELHIEVPEWVANICWVRFKEGYGSIAGQGRQRNGTDLGMPYCLTKRISVAITLGKIPRQLSLDLE